MADLSPDKSHAEALKLARIVVQFHESNAEYEAEVVRQIAQALIDASTPSHARQNVYWLIEHKVYKPRRYWTFDNSRTGDDVSPMVWGTDPAKAMRYPTREDAMKTVMVLNETCGAYDHMDCNGPTHAEIDASAPSAIARKPSDKLPNSCPYCGADTHGGAEWAFWERQHTRETLDLIDEVEALRRGVAVTHLVDPLPSLKQRVGTREALEAADRAMRAADGGKA